jgi:purine-binding chemotaxis protein CheW
MDKQNQNSLNHNMLQLVTFGVGDCVLGVEIEHVQEINRQLELTPVPGAPSSIRGVINLRGDVVTVLNLHFLLNMQPLDRSRSSRNLILKIGGERVGVLVDHVSDILAISPDAIVRRPPNLSQVDRRYIRGVHNRDEAVVVILDPYALANAAADLAPAA